MNFHPSKETHFPLFYNDFPSFVCVLFFTARLLSSRCASRGLCNLLGNQGHRVAESLQLSNRTMRKSCTIPLLKIIRSQIVVGLLGGEDMIDNDQKTMGHSHGRLLLAQPTCQTVILSRKVVIFHMRKHPDHFCQNGP